MGNSEFGMRKAESSAAGANRPPNPRMGTIGEKRTSRIATAALSPINMSGGGSPEGAEVQTCALFSPLWAFFGYFLARQKVTTSRPQTRWEQRKNPA